jgi:hypothetical protein
MMGILRRWYRNEGKISMMAMENIKCRRRKGPWRSS